MHFVEVPLLNGDTADVNIDQITHMRVVGCFSPASAQRW
jgi:hypothetical protein